MYMKIEGNRRVMFIHKEEPSQGMARPSSAMDEIDWPDTSQSIV